jgi:hypothetical protein
MKDQIKNLRVEIDGLSQLTKELKVLLGYAFDKSEVYGISKEIEKAYDNLILAKAWLGKLLQELGESTINDDTSVIVPGLREPFTGKDNTHNLVSAIDTWELNGKSMNFYSDFNHIQKVDYIREEVSKISKVVRQLWMQPGELTDWKFTHMDLTKIMYVLLMHVEKYLTEARFWLGFELQRIKENK